MQTPPFGHPPGPTHEAFASVAVRHTLSLAQNPMRLSILRQDSSLAQVNLQNPPRQRFGVSVLPPHWLSVVQFGVGRVSGAHAPWLQ